MDLNLTACSFNHSTVALTVRYLCKFNMLGTVKFGSQFLELLLSLKQIQY